jgi:hypothetical protein
MSFDASRSLLVFLAAVALLSGCDDMTLYRAKSDYFPLIPGSRWTYDAAGNTAIDSVVGDSAIDDRACVVVLRDYAPEYWTKQVTEVQQFTKLVVNRSGQDYVLEERFRLAYALPLVKGATWSDSFQAAVVLQGTDTVPVKDNSLGRVAEIEDVSTPAGTFLQCYRIEIHREVEAAELSFTADYSEWLAPDVGLVRRVTGTDTTELTAYTPGR